MIRLAVSTEYRRVTDRRTDGQTDERTSFDSIVSGKMVQDRAMADQ